MQDPKAPEFLRLVSSTADSLFKYYQSHNPDATEEEFAEQYAVPMMNSSEKAGQFVLDTIKEIQRVGALRQPKYASMMVALGYLAQAAQAHHSGLQDWAYIYFADAKYWAGVTWASLGLESARDSTVKETVSSRARTAARSKNKELRELAIVLATRRPPEGLLPPSGRWRNKSAAAKAVSARLRLEADRLKVAKLSEDEERRTVSRWLAEDPDASSLIREKS